MLQAKFKYSSKVETNEDSMYEVIKEGIELEQHALRFRLVTFFIQKCKD